MSEKPKTSVLTQEIVEKACVCTLLGGEALGCNHPVRERAIEVSREALKADIQELVAGRIKEAGTHFWLEVFGEGRSNCQYCAKGFCIVRQAGGDATCPYIFVIKDGSGDDNEDICIKTRAAMEAFRVIFEAYGEPIEGRLE